MSISASELICYGSASRPTDDTSTSGGAIDATMRPVFTQFSSSAVLSLTSNAADTRTVNIVGRNAAGEYGRGGNLQQHTERQTTEWSRSR